MPGTPYHSEKELQKLHREITAAFEESTRANNRDWLKYFWEIMMEESNMSKQQIIDLMLDELNRGNESSHAMLKSILDHTR
jgi:hypothetical protein